MWMIPHSTLRQCLTGIPCDTKTVQKGLCYRWARHLVLFVADTATIHGAIVCPIKTT